MAASDERIGAMEVKTFVLANIPEIEDKFAYLIDYLEGTLERDVEGIELHPGIPDRALITLKQCTNISCASEKTAKAPMEDHQLKVLPVKLDNVVVVQGENLKSKLTYRFVQLYFQSKFKDGEEIVSKYIEIPKTNTLAVSFVDAEVTKRILEHSHHTPLPEEKYDIDVLPFYHNFHGMIPYKDMCLSQALKENVDKPTRADDRAGQEQIQKLQSRRSEERFEDRESGRISKGGVEEKRRQEEEPSVDHAEEYGSDIGITRLSDDRNDSDIYSDSDTKKEKLYPDNESSVDSIRASGNCDTLFDSGDDVQEVKVTLNEAEWNILKDKVDTGKYGDLNYDHTMQVLTMKGKDVQDFHTSFYTLKSKVLQHHQKIDENMQRFLRSPRAAKELTAGLTGICWSIENEGLHAYAFDESMLKCLKQKMNSFVLNFEKKIMEKDLSEEYLRKTKIYWEKNCFVNILWNLETITIVGLMEDVDKVEKEIVKDKMKETQVDKKTFKKSFEFTELHYKLLVTHFKSEITDAVNNVTIHRRVGQEGAMVLEGKESHVDKAVDNLKQIQKKIKTEIIDVNKEIHPDEKRFALIAELSSLVVGSHLSNMQSDFEKANQCIILNDSRTAWYPSGVGAQKSVQVKGNADVHNKKTLFRVIPSVILEIKHHGNITEELSEMLVCVVPREKTLQATSVGKAFLALAPYLQTEFKKLDFSNNVAVTSCTFKGKPTKYLAFVNMSKWQVSLEFQSIVEEVLKVAMSCAVKSVSFPPLGDGKALGYSKNFISENFFSALTSKAIVSMQQSSLRKITFLSPNQDLFDTMKTVGSKYLQSLSQDYHDNNWTFVQQNKDGSLDVHDDNVWIKIVHKRTYDNLASQWKTKLMSRNSFPVYCSTPV